MPFKESFYLKLNTFNNTLIISGFFFKKNPEKIRIPRTFSHKEVKHFEERNNSYSFFMWKRSMKTDSVVFWKF